MSQVTFESVLNFLQESYCRIVFMTQETYDEYTVTLPLRIVLDLNKYTEEEQKRALVYVYKILNTNAGSILLNSSRYLTERMITKAEEFMSNVVIESDLDTDLTREIVKFSFKNERVFVAHALNYVLYYGYGENEWEDDEQDDEQDDEEEDDEDDEEEEELNDQQLIEALAAYDEKILRKQQQEWRDKMVLVHEHLRRRNDPFYVAALKMNQEKKENEEAREKRRQLRVLRNILRRELECGKLYSFLISFKCDYELVEQYTGVKVVDDFAKKFGCDFSVRYGKADKVTVRIFDGVYFYKYKLTADMPTILKEVRKEIRNDVAQCLYDNGVCWDVAGVICQYL